MMFLDCGYAHFRRIILGKIFGGFLSLVVFLDPVRSVGRIAFDLGGDIRPRRNLTKTKERLRFFTASLLRSKCPPKENTMKLR